MRNGIKRMLSEQELAALIGHAFGQAVSNTAELTEGWANSAYSVKMQDGREVVVKAAPLGTTVLMEYEQGLMEAEVGSLRLVRQLGLAPVPEVYIYDATQKLVDCEYFIMEKLPGEPYHKVKQAYTDEQRYAIEYKLGEYNRSINEIKGTHFGLYAASANQFPTWRDAFASLLEGVLRDGERAEVQLPASYREIREAVTVRLNTLDEVTEPRLVLWDLWDANVFVENGAITGIIDFERAMWGDPLMEHYFSHFNQSQAFRDGYGVPEPDGKAASARRALYDLYMDLIMLIECPYRQYEDEEHLNWAKQNAEQGWARFRGMTD